jgi:uracil-DNA glycosylase family 4
MDARLLLRRYLEQRRELGESELVLDGLNVEDVMRLLGATGRSVARTETRVSVRELAGEQPDDWRTALQDAGVSGETPIAGPRAASTPAESTRTPGPPRAAREPSASAEATPVPSPAPNKRMAFPPEPLPQTTAAEFAAESAPTAEKVVQQGVIAPRGIIIGSGEVELIAGAIEKLDSLEAIAEQVRKCTRCSLYATATNPVPGEGNPNADLVCVGEAPGAKEDETGRPFIGQAGQLLTQILKAIDLPREEVFICNVLKHRPPANRNPLPEEVEACSPYLIRQLELIKPKVIIAFGTFAAQTLLNTKTSLGQLRGLIHQYHGIPLIVTYHPAALLRNPAWKRPTWEDVKLARRILDSSPRS